MSRTFCIRHLIFLGIWISDEKKIMIRVSRRFPEIIITKTREGAAALPQLSVTPDWILSHPRRFVNHALFFPQKKKKKRTLLAFLASNGDNFTPQIVLLDVLLWRRASEEEKKGNCMLSRIFIWWLKKKRKEVKLISEFILSVTWRWPFDFFF